MAHSKHQRPSATTPPKGRATPLLADAVGGRRDTVSLQWAALGAAIVGIVAGPVYLGGDWGSQPTHGGGGGLGAPAVVVDASLTARLDQVG